MSTATPRVNKELLGKFVGKEVCLVGKKQDVGGASVTVEAADNGIVTVSRTTDAALPTTTYVEVIGVVRADGTLEERQFFPHGDVFDLEVYNEAVKVMHTPKFTALFA